MRTVIILLSVGLTALVLFVTVRTQTTLYEAFQDSAAQSEQSAYIAVGNGTFYLAVTGHAEDGLLGPDDAVKFGNGHYVLSGDRIVDCDEDATVCRGLLLSASNDPAPTDALVDVRPPPNAVPSNVPPKHDEAETEVVYLAQFEVMPNGAVRYDPSGRRTAGAWGLRMLPAWFDARRVGSGEG
ncbi:MAG: hypothetical protein AAFN13_02595 [Bacteroidota bacterium]